jgi:hypothetical protein
MLHALMGILRAAGVQRAVVAADDVDEEGQGWPTRHEGVYRRGPATKSVDQIINIGGGGRAAGPANAPFLNFQQSRDNIAINRGINLQKLSKTLVQSSWVFVTMGEAGEGLRAD